MAASFTGQDVPLRASDAYVRSTFDHFAANFEKQLEKLEYRAPELVAAATAAALGDPRGAFWMCSDAPAAEPAGAARMFALTPGIRLASISRRQWSKGRETGRFTTN